MPPAPPPAPRPTPIRPDRRLWLSAAVPLAVGGFMGYQAAYTHSLGGFNTIAAGFLVIVIGVLAGIACLIGIGNALRPAGRGRVASRYSFAAAALIAGGGVGGAAAVPVFDLGYHAPVVLEARGEARASLVGVADFTPRASGRADCLSVGDGIEVESVVALSLGQLNGNELRASIALGVPGMSEGFVSLFVDAAHLPDGSAQPMWTSQEPEVDASPGGATGTVRFAAAPLQQGAGQGEPAGPWPQTLSGEITWTCGPWYAPDASAEPSIEGRITLDLSSVAWTATAGSPGRCEFEPDGSVWTVNGDQVGLLQAAPMSLTLDLGGDPRPGDEVHLWLSVHLASPSGTSPLPMGALVAATAGRTIGWTDLVTIEEITDDGRRGRLTFSDVPMETTPDRAWPATLTGDLGWECG